MKILIRLLFAVWGLTAGIPAVANAAAAGSLPDWHSATAYNLTGPASQAIVVGQAGG